MADQIYKVRDPSGAIREIRGPEGATDEQVIEQAKALFSSAPKAEEKPGIMQQMVSGITKGMPYGIIGATAGAMPAIQRGIDETAYAAGGKVTDAATKIGLSPEVAAGAGFATNVGIQAVPAVLGGQGAKAAAPVLESGAERLMQSALKPTLKDLQTGRAATAIQTMLDEGINATKGGVEKLRSKISELNREITQAIVSSPATVDKGKVASTLFDLTKKVEKQATPQADLAEITKAWDEFLTHPLLTGKQDIPVQLAQELKQGTYRALGNKSYGEMKGIDTEAQKALARGLKDEIATAVPGVGALNAEESQLLTALKVAERRAMMEGNKNPAGLGLLAHNTGGMAAFLADRSGLAKSLLARLLHSGSENIPNAAVGGTMGAGLGLSSLSNRK